MIPARSMARLLAEELGCRAEVRAAGRYVHVHYAGDSLGATATLDLDRAFAFLQALRHGFRGRHTELPSVPTSVPRRGAYVIATALSGLDDALLPVVDLTGLPGERQGGEWYDRSAPKGTPGPVVGFRLTVSGTPAAWPAHAALPEVVNA